ncbi:hypothetical protein VP1G_02383 [Cytospora mali]|uniref:Uncharacterized protein n=1 Tax=Cytospora mali TaxID=578113 RepID=A0A194UTV6_CYTMA|nr:hypothetical protein VP1G_02383 [Valsa mali var. pyri (nom. inval.)]
MSNDEEAPNYEDPPPYNDLDQDEILQPVVLLLAGQSIVAETAVAETADSIPLYKLNRGIASLTHASQKVDFERVQRTIKMGSDGNPTIRTRDRLIYNLRHQRTSTGGLEPLPSDSPYYFIESVSTTTRAIGNLGIKKLHFRQHWKVLPVDVSGKNSKAGVPQFLKNAAPVFEIDYSQNRYEWLDAKGQAIAVESDRGDKHRLIVMASLPQQTMDALPIHEGMEGVRRKFNLVKDL